MSDETVRIMLDGMSEEPIAIPFPFKIGKYTISNPDDWCDFKRMYDKEEVMEDDTMKPSFPPRMKGWEYQYQRAEELERQNRDLRLKLSSEEASDKVYPPLWLIWAMSDRKEGYHLRAICTSQSIADQKRKYINGFKEVIHVRADKITANHVFGDNMIRQVSKGR